MACDQFPGHLQKILKQHLQIGWKMPEYSLHLKYLI